MHHLTQIAHTHCMHHIDWRSRRDVWINGRKSDKIAVMLQDATSAHYTLLMCIALKSSYYKPIVNGTYHSNVHTIMFSSSSSSYISGKWCFQQFTLDLVFQDLFHPNPQFAFIFHAVGSSSLQNQKCDIACVFTLHAQNLLRVGLSLQFGTGTQFVSPSWYKTTFFDWHFGGIRFLPDNSILVSQSRQ